MSKSIKIDILTFILNLNRLLGTLLALDVVKWNIVFLIFGYMLSTTCLKQGETWSSKQFQVPLFWFMIHKSQINIILLFIKKNVRVLNIYCV